MIVMSTSACPHVQDPDGQSCAAAFNHTYTAQVAERDGKWHHLAVTWTAADNGFTQIFLDGDFSIP